MIGLTSLSCVGDAVAGFVGPVGVDGFVVGPVGVDGSVVGPVGLTSLPCVGDAVAGFVGPVGVDGVCAASVGAGVGDSVRTTSMILAVGLRVGEEVGLTVGARVGLFVGCEVGAGESKLKLGRLSGHVSTKQGVRYFEAKSV
jgi:hypothetical protein